MSWQNLFHPLLSEFQEAARKGYDFRLIIAKLRNRADFDRLQFRLENQNKAAALFGAGQTYAEMYSWIVSGSEEHELDILVGETEGVKRFETLGRAAGACLPTEVRPTHPFHTFTGQPRKKRFDNLRDWVGYLFERLLHGPLCSSLESEEEWPSPGCFITRLTTDPFLASVQVIELELRGWTAGGKSGHENKVNQGLEEDRLNSTEKKLLKVLGNEILTGEKIAERAGYRFNSNIKSTLSSLKKRGFLGNKSPGYFLTDKGHDKGHD